MAHYWLLIQHIKHISTLTITATQLLAVNSDATCQMSYRQNQRLHDNRGIATMP